MRLINCQTLTLDEFPNHRQVKYATLSHMWRKDGEVLYDDFAFHQPMAKLKLGWRKITQVCDLAVKDGLEYAWIDTCCIDKSSSAELSEAINSMFVWYRDSEACYAFLSDYDSSNTRAEMDDSRWFKRGWTLQELIAPARVLFYDRVWKAIGTKASLCQELASITGIQKDILRASENRDLEEMLSKVPVAKRMSWASKRVTTRVEDTAYCLLGIFGINLPLLYGEGERAFTRLQEEIVRNTNDLSILAWTSKDTTGRLPFCGVFARHPVDFFGNSSIELANDLKYAPDFAVTNKGLKIFTVLQYDDEYDLHVLELNCLVSETLNDRLAIYLMHQGASVYARALPHRVAEWSNKVVKGSFTDIYAENMLFFLSTSLPSGSAKALLNVHRNSFLIDEKHKDFNVVRRSPEILWSTASNSWTTDGLRDFVGCQHYAPSDLHQDTTHAFKHYYLLFGFGYGYDPWVKVSQPTRNLQLRIRTENWRQLAAEANDEHCHTLGIGQSSARTLVYAHVELKRAKHHGVEVYQIEARFTEEETSEALGD